MKRYLIFLFVIVLGLSACTLSLKDFAAAEVVSVEHQEDGSLVIYLRNVEEGSTVTVNGQVFDCKLMADNSGILVCTGPGLKPGEELVIKIFDKEGNADPVSELTSTVPDYPEGQDADVTGSRMRRTAVPGTRTRMTRDSAAAAFRKPTKMATARLTAWTHARRTPK